MGQISDSYNHCTATVLSQHNTSDKQLLSVEPPQTGAEAVLWVDSSWLDGYAYSTLPVKGEESLVSSTASSAGPQNLDNRISTPLSDGDQPRGFLG